MSEWIPGGVESDAVERVVSNSSIEDETGAPDIWAFLCDGQRQQSVSQVCST